MRKFATVAAVAAAMMAFAGASSASAASWSAQNTGLFGPSKTMQFTSQAGNITYCPGQIPSWSGKASGAVLSWAGPSLTGCNVSTGGTASITPSGQWSLTASTVSSVALKADTVPSGGTVLTIKQAQTGCIIAVKGPLSLSGLPWNNSTHTFALENSVAIQASGPGFCNGIIGSSMIITGTISIPGETILP